MTQVPQSERSQRIARRQIVNLLAYVPVVAMPSERGVMLCNGRIRGDVAVEELERIRPQQVGHGGRQVGKIGQDRFAQIDVSSWGPGVHLGREQQAQQPHARAGEREAQQRHQRLGTRKRRTRPSMPFPRRTDRSAAAASRAAPSTSSCTTSYSVSSSSSLISIRSAARMVLRRRPRAVWAKAPASWRTSTMRSWPCSVSRRSDFRVRATSSCSPSTRVLTLRTCPATLKATTATANARPRNESAKTASEIAATGPTHSWDTPTCASARVIIRLLPPGKAHELLGCDLRTNLCPLR